MIMVYQAQLGLFYAQFLSSLCANHVRDWDVLNHVGIGGFAERVPGVTCVPVRGEPNNSD